MRNETRGIGWFGFSLRLALMLSLFAALGAIAEDENAAPPPVAPTPARPDPATAPAKVDKADKNATDDEGSDYEKNAARRFTPTERTPADKNISFPVDI